MKKIETLTDTQKARFPEFVEKWARIGLDTARADRPRAEAAICKMYEIAGLKPPRVVWCTSPLAMTLTHVVLQKMPDSVRALVGDSVWDSVRASVYGQHDANWLGWGDYFSEVLSLTEQTQKLAGLWELSKSAGWALPHANICWVSERHCVVLQDDRKRIHCENGPAIQYPDGWAIFAWHGVRVPEAWIVDKTALTASAALGQQNVEHRRAACEIVGWTRILQELNAKTIDKDGDPEIGELVEVNLPDAGKERFLRVLCGTGREFAIPVPREMKTALAANAWTYDLPIDLMKLKENRT